MGMTLLESALYGTDELKKAVAKIIVENSPILDDINFKTIKGNSYTYRLEQALPSVAFRGVNQTYTSNTGIINPFTEVLTILGGEVFIDNFEIKTQGNVIDIKAKQFELKARAAAQKFDSAFFNGDTNTDPYSFDGLRKRLTGAQVINANGATGDAVLTLAMLDQLIDAVPFPDKVLYMNRTMRRKITALERAQTGVFRVETTLNNLGKQLDQYAGVPIKILEHMNDASTILDYNEDPGDGVADTASVYCVSFGNEEKVHGIMNGNWDVKDFGEIQSAPGHLGRIEIYLGMAIQHPRAAARLRGILNG